MTTVSTSIPNLINGVSQQPAALRMSSQCDEQINAFPSVVEGLVKRPPTQHVAKVSSGVLGLAHIHMINRDTSERYKVILTNGDLKVYTLDGVEKTVAFPDGKAYLTAPNPVDDFRTVTIADYTFIVNDTINTAMDTTLSVDRGGEAIVFVKVANYETTYEIAVTGGSTASNTTSATSISTTAIASSLASGLSHGSFTITRQGSVIHIKKNDGAAFEVKITDSRGNTQMTLATNTVQRFTELPTIAPTGYVVEVMGDNTSNFDNYFVKFVPNFAGATFDEGQWEETVQPGMEFMIDAATMPYSLVREGDGTFTFQQIVWGARVAGDIDSSPNPSFIGTNINDVFFEDNRLSFLADDNVIQSRSADFFEFFPSTVTTVVESDPIDIAASHTKVSILRHAVPFNSQILLFSDQTQFNLEKNESTGLKEIKVLTEFESSSIAKPVGAGKTVYFATSKGSFTGIREYFSEGSGTAASNDAADVTAHVPNYLPSNVFKLAVASNEDILMCLSSVHPNRVYVYKYYWSGNEKLQSAWNFFEFSVNAVILNVDFVETDAYFLVQYPDGIYIEKMGVEPGRTDPFATFEYLLDRKVSNADISVAYDVGTDRTTWTLPYTPDAEIQVAVRNHTTPETSTIPPGTKLTTTFSGTSVIATGDHSTTPVFLGQKYLKTYRFSKPSLKEATGSGGKAIVTEGRLQIKFFSLAYDTTGFFTVEVTPERRSTKEYKYTGNIIGSTSAVLGEVTLGSGFFKVPVLSKSDRFVLEIKNDSFLPSRIVSAGWEGFHSIRSRRL